MPIGIILGIAAIITAIYALGYYMAYKDSKPDKEKLWQLLEFPDGTREWHCNPKRNEFTAENQSYIVIDFKNENTNPPCKKKK